MSSELKCPRCEKTDKDCRCTRADMKRWGWDARMTEAAVTQTTREGVACAMEEWARGRGWLPPGADHPYGARAHWGRIADRLSDLADAESVYDTPTIREAIAALRRVKDG